MLFFGMINILPETVFSSEFCILTLNKKICFDISFFYWMNKNKIVKLEINHSEIQTIDRNNQINQT